MVDSGIQYALNIEKDAVELSERTLYRCLEWLRKADPQGGSASDMESLSDVEDKLKIEGHLPENAMQTAATAPIKTMWNLPKTG